MGDSFRENFKETVIKLLDILIFSAAAVVVGAAAGAIDALFGGVLAKITEFREAHTAILLPFLPVAGLVVLWVYRKIGGDSIKGMGVIFEVKDERRGNVPFRIIPLAMGSTWLTHLVGGSVGREGVAVQMSCVVSYNAARLIPIKNAKKILLVAGVAAGFAGLFRTPLAAVFFALELFSIGLLEIESLLPALCAAFSATIVSGLLGIEKFSAQVSPAFDLDAIGVLCLIALGVASGLAGLAFSRSIRGLKKLFTKLLPNAYLRIAIVGAVTAGLLLLCGMGRYAGASEGLISAAVGKGGEVYAWDFAAKLIFTAMCVAAGYMGGEVAPLFAIGSTMGAVLGAAMGMPPQFAAVLCYAAVFGAGTNTLIAPMLVGAEIFGWEFMPYLAIVCAIAYFMNFDRSIYPQHKIAELFKK